MFVSYRHRQDAMIDVYIPADSSQMGGLAGCQMAGPVCHLHVESQSARWQSMSGVQTGATHCALCDGLALC